MDWIKTEDELPENCFQIITCNKFNDVSCGYYMTSEHQGVDETGWYDDEMVKSRHVPTHWMPLPNPPKQI